MTSPAHADALRLVYVVDALAAADAAHLEQVLAGGVTAMWLRAPACTGRELYDLAVPLRERTRRYGAALLVGDRADVALACEADGVQLGHRAPPPARVRHGYRGWLGVSCHDRAGLQAARAAGADHAVLSPLAVVPGKGPPLGAAAFARLCAGAGLPVVALGGITAREAAVALEAGAVGVAVQRALREAPDARGTARGLLAAMTGA